MLPGNYIIWLGVIFTAFWGGWETQGWHRDSQEKDRAEANAESQRLAQRAITANETRVVHAQNASAARSNAYRADADALRGELDGMRADTAAALAAAQLSHAACIDRAAALSDVFQSCAGASEVLAEKADRHVNDLKTLSEAWPVNGKSD